MNTPYNYRQFSLLFVDDETRTASNFDAYFSDTFDIILAHGGEEAWNLFSANPDRFGMVMTDQRMPNGPGVELLEKIRAARPRIIRILATAFSDLDVAIAAVNSGAIYKYITKPWDPPFLEMTLKRGMEFFLVQRELDALLNEKMSALQRLMMSDRLLSMGVLAAGLNHHLRNSLTAVKMFLDLAPSQLQSENVDLASLRNPNYWHDFYQTAQEQMKKIVGLLEGIRQIPEPIGMPLADEVSLGDVVAEALQSQMAALSAKRIDVQIQGGAVSKIQANRHLLLKGISLLLADESANVPASGKVVIILSEGLDEKGRAGAFLDVSDNGPGLSAANLDSVFDPFFVRQNSPSEYGLNLLTCFFVVFHHNGTMTIDRSPEGGAHFRVFLPGKPPEADRMDEQSYLERVFDMQKACERMLIGL